MTDLHEALDFFDANLRHRGVARRDRVHTEGLWHRSFHLWLVDREDGGALLFQKRSAGVKDFPNFLDVTAAGHLMAGESPIDGLREVREELGIDIELAALHNLGYRTEAMDIASGTRNREYQAVYMTETALTLSQFAPHPAEVAGLIRLRIADLYNLLNGAAASVNAVATTTDTLTGGQRVGALTVSAADLLPRIPSYYLAVAIMAERLLEGRRPLAIG